MPAMSRTVFIVALASLMALGHAQASPAVQGDRGAASTPRAADERAIRHVLDVYVRSVSTGDERTFESQLLDLKIPFSYVGEGASTGGKGDLATFQDYEGFRRTIFRSHEAYRQRFSRIRIEQVGNLAQVRLDYQTALQGQPYRGVGWKVLQLLRIDGRWKIASEFFTGYPASG
jgi:hypothetical protein